MSTYRINGRVIDRKDRFGIPRLRIEAWDKDLLFDDFVGKTITDGDGVFQISFKESYFQELFLDRNPDLYFKIFRKNKLIASTENSVLWNASRRDISITVEVDANATEVKHNSLYPRYVIHGTVTGANSRKLAEAEVTIWRMLIRSRSPLASDHTSRDGYYSISYHPPVETQGKFEIVVEAKSKDLATPLESPLVDAQPDLQIDLHEEPTDQSEFAKLIHGIAPLINGLKITDIVENDKLKDLSFLAHELGRSTEEIMRIVVAARLEAAFGIPAVAFYAFLQQRVPATLPSPLLEASHGFKLIDALVHSIGSLIFALTPDVQKRTFETAIKQNLIGPQHKEQIPNLVNQLQAQRTTDVLGQPYLVGKTTLNQLLDTAQLAKEKQRVFAQALVDNTQSMRKFWKTLGDGKHGFTAAEASAVQLTLEIGAFVKNHLPLVQSLLEDFNAGTYKSLTDLARLSKQDWIELVNKVGAPVNVNVAGSASPAEVFARVIYSRITRAYPTAAFASRITTGTFIPGTQQKPLNQFFLNNPALELSKINLATYLNQHGDKVFNGIEAEDRPGVIKNAKRMQRVLRIASNVDTSETLLSLGIHSATQIATMGKQQFFNKATTAGITKPEANKVYEAGVQRYGSLVSLLTQYNRDAIGIWPKAIGSTTDLDQPTSDAILRDQSLATLFGSQDYCTVDGCMSILSPAAYVCDLLLWLRNHPLNGPFPTALAALFDRRPDLGHLLLNCPNTETPLPYIDLVNELLEDAVSPPNPPLWKQTTWNAAELRATPEYVNTAAYAILAAANYPHTLPYDSQLDILRNCLDQSKVPLWQLRQALLPVHNQTLDQQVSIAAERFGINPHERELITIATSLTGPITDSQSSITVASDVGFASPNFYVSIGSETLIVTAVSGAGNTTWTVLRGQQGTTAGSALAGAPVTVSLLKNTWNTTNPVADLGPVPVFLRAASITYSQLLELINAAWVQGTLKIVIEGINDLCDSSKEALVPSTTLTVPITASQVSITVASDIGFPSSNFYINIGTETLLVTTVSGADSTTWAVLRGQLGTTASSALVGASVTAIPPTPLDAGFLDRAHRFLRLWRHCGWKMWELDLLLSAPLIGNNVLDANTLLALFTFRLLQDMTSLPVDQQLAFFQDLDIDNHRDPDGTETKSLFAQIFLNTTVPEDDDLKAILTGSAIADSNISNHLPAIQAALQISSSDAATLFSLTNGQLMLANLSFIYRVITLTRAVKLSLTDFQRVVPLTTAGSIAAAFGTPARTLDFIQQVNKIQQSGFTVDALIYVLTTQSTSIGITQDQITNTVLPAVRGVIQQTNDEIYASADQPLTILQRELAQLPAFAEPTLLDTAMSIVDDTYTGTLVARNNFITTNFGLFMDLVTAQADLAPLPAGLSPAQLQAAIDLRAQQVLGPLATYLTQTHVIAALATNLQLQNDVSALLVQQLTVPGTPLTPLTVLTDPALISREADGSYTPINLANYLNQYLAMQLLDKIGIVVRRLHLVKTDLSWLLANATVYTGLNLKQLPVLNAQPPLTIAALLTTSLLMKLDRTFNEAQPAASIQNLCALISGVADGTIANEATVQTALAIITGWTVNDITSLATAIGVSYAGGDYTKPVIYESLRTLEIMVMAFGQQTVAQNFANGVQLVSWGVPAPNEAATTSALGVLKARYSNDDWLQVAPTMMNPIRERRSAALQSYLVSQRNGAGTLVYGDTNALFNHFLIDVQMSSCEVTTRVIQAYAAIQLFVERCLMSLEEPNIIVDLTKDDTWSQWKWMKRYRIWEANRKVFLYPENWLIESQRPNRTEIFKKLEQEVHQNDNTLDYLETVSLNYIDRLDEIAHLLITGTCSDPLTGEIHVVARTQAEPPRFYHRSFLDGTWTGWEQIPFDIKAHQVVPAVYRRRLCLFWPDIKISNEPHQNLPAAQQSSSPPSQDVAKYVSIGLDFSVFRNGAWAPSQKIKGKLFDIPILNSQVASDSKSVEALYTLKVQTPAQSPEYGATLFIDVFRLGKYSILAVSVSVNNGPWQTASSVIDKNMQTAQHLGRAVFDGQLSDLVLQNVDVLYNGPGDLSMTQLLTHSLLLYGQDAQLLQPLTNPDPDITSELGLVPQAGALMTLPGLSSPHPLIFSPDSPLDLFGALPLLLTASVPFRVVGPASSLGFDPDSYFFYQDNRRCYFVESIRYYQSGSAWLPIAPSNPYNVPFEVRYRFHRFYHPYTKLLWHQLSGGGFPAFYNRDLQLSPDTIDQSKADVFSFESTYSPLSPRVDWSQGKNLSEDRNKEIIDFSPAAAYSVYNWELFFHNPLYIAERLSQNQKFEDALKWFHFIFNPTRQGPEPAPQRFWIPKPLNSLTTPQILQQRINELLQLVNQGDPDAVAQVTRWRKDSFNPFLIADQRPVAYMKHVAMSYLDNLIAWADNLYSTDSREALNEATLLYVIAAEILGPQPVAIMPPKHADASYVDLEPKLDAFANALVDIENLIGAGGNADVGGGDGMPMAQTFYFKIPPNDKLLGYWKTVANRLFMLRHCQNIAGVERQLALFDAPIDPGLLIKAQAAGVDIGSVLNDVTAPLPNYRFTVLYSQALEFVNAVRAYGTSLLGAIEKNDGAALALLQQTTAQQLLRDADQISEWQVEQAGQALTVFDQSLDLAQSTYDHYSRLPYMNEGETAATVLSSYSFLLKHGPPVMKGISAILHALPNANAGATGAGGSPTATLNEGGTNAGHSADKSSEVMKELIKILDDGAKLAEAQGRYARTYEENQQKAAQAKIQIQLVKTQIDGAKFALQIAQQNQANHQEQIDNIQQQIDFLTNKFTNQDLYDWMVGQLADTYFQSYRLAYNLCKRLERCYRYELGIPDSCFIQFGYWDSLRKGLLAGETLNHDLRRMQASYLEQNSRRFEISRFISLVALDPNAFVDLFEKGMCDFDLPESLFDSDYPGHYQRRLVRASLTVVYPNPGKFDNVKGTLTLVKNSVRISIDLSSGYARQPGKDPRFVDQYAAVPQKIVLGNAQDDPGLFLTSINNNLSDQRYVPFEGAGAISSWHLELPAENNEIDFIAVSDIVIHLYYTALDGGDTFKQAVQADNAQNLPTQGVKIFSALNDFSAPSPDPAPAPAEGPTQTPWQSFLATPAAGNDQQLVLSISPSKFPSWTRGKTITVTNLTLFVVSWNGGAWVLQPQAPLPTGDVNLQPVANTETLASGIIAVPANTFPGKWTFKLRKSTAADFHSLSKNDIGDVFLLVNFQVV